MFGMDGRESQVVEEVLADLKRTMKYFHERFWKWCSVSKNRNAVWGRRRFSALESAILRSVWNLLLNIGSFGLPFVFPPLEMLLPTNTQHHWWNYKKRFVTKQWHDQVGFKRQAEKEEREDWREIVGCLDTEWVLYQIIFKFLLWHFCLPSFA